MKKREKISLITHRFEKSECGTLDLALRLEIDDPIRLLKGFVGT